MPNLVALLVPLPMIRSPVVVMGDKALNPALAVVWPVPPLAMGSVPVTPVVKGNPVALVNVTLVGVPNIGVTNVGDVLKTLFPEPVDVVTPVPPFKTGNVPVTPVDKGKPVALVNVTLVGVPRIGVTKVGDVANTKDPVPVSSVTAAAKLALDGVAKNVATPVASPETPVLIGNPVALVKTPLAGVPKAGVVNVGLVNVLLVSVCVPVNVATVLSIAMVTAVPPL